jgi:hypothetical protein
MLETQVFREDEAVRNDIQRSRAPGINAESRAWFRLAHSQDEEPSQGTAIPQLIILYINKADPRLLVPQRSGIGWTPNFGSSWERSFSWWRSSLASFTPASGLISRLSNSP